MAPDAPHLDMAPEAMSTCQERMVPSLPELTKVLEAQPPSQSLPSELPGKGASWRESTPAKGSCSLQGWFEGFGNQIVVVGLGEQTLSRLGH